MKLFNYNKLKEKKLFGHPTHPNDWLQKRERHYGKFLGRLDNTLFHDTTLTAPHIDIYTILPNKKEGRNFHTLITSGMSDLIQSLPKGVDKAKMGRIELIWYVDKIEPWMFDFMLKLAKTPFEYKTFFWYFHTLENSFPSIYNKSKLNHLMLIPNFESKDFNEGLTLNREKVNFLLIYPITREEIAYKIENGSEAMKSVLLNSDINPVFNPYRKSLI